MLTLFGAFMASLAANSALAIADSSEVANRVFEAPYADSAWDLDLDINWGVGWQLGGAAPQQGSPSTGPRPVSGTPAPGSGTRPGGGGGYRPGRDPRGGGYNGPGGRGTPSPFGGPGGRGTPGSTPEAQPGGIGQPDGSEPFSGPGGASTPSQPGGQGGGPGGPGGGLPGAGTGGSPPIPGPGPGPRTGGTTRRGAVLSEGSWLNWWQLNELHELELERRYRERTLEKEPNHDLFIGEPTRGEARPINGGSKRIRAKIMPTLKELAQDKDPRVRAAAALSMGRAGRSEAVALLVPMTKDKQLQVRKAALLALGLTQERRAYSYLLWALEAPTNKNAERAFAAIALGILGDPRAAPRLVKAVDRGNQSQEVKAAALYALGRTKTSQARVYLEYFVLRPYNDDRLRAVAIHGLLGLDKPRYAALFSKSLTDSNVHVRRSAAIAIGLTGYQSAYRADLEAVEYEFSRGRDAGVSGMPRAREEIENYIGRLRVKVEEDERSLGMLRSQAARRLEKQALSDADPIVRYFALISLGRIGGDDEVEALTRVFKTTKSNSERAFAALGLGLSKHQAAAAPLMRTLRRQRQDELTRAAVVLSLGLLEERKAAPLVLKQFRSRHGQSLQNFSALALGLFEAEDASRRVIDTLVSRSRPELKRRFGASAGLLHDDRAIKAIEERLARRAPVQTSIAYADALALFPDERSLDAVLAAIKVGKMKDSVRVASARALGSLAEKGDLPIMSDMFRGLNYLLRFEFLNEAALL